MPVYRYKHDTGSCDLGAVFEVEQPIRDEALKECPACAGKIHRLISRTFIATPKTDSELKSLGFTKLVKRDQGVYENVTRTGKESRYMEAGKADTLPDIKRKISD